MKMNCGNGACVVGRYYLVEAGYALEIGYMAPFKKPGTIWTILGV